MEIVALFLVIPAVVSCFVFLGSINAYRNNGLAWGDAFLKSFTKAFVWNVVILVLEIAAALIIPQLGRH